MERSESEEQMTTYLVYAKRPRLDLELLRAVLENGSSGNVKMCAVEDVSDKEGWMIACLEGGDTELGVAICRWTEMKRPVALYARYRECIGNYTRLSVPSYCIVVERDLRIAAEKLSHALWVAYREVRMPAADGMTSAEGSHFL